MPTEFDMRIKVAIYRHFAETGRRPTLAEVAERAGADSAFTQRAAGGGAITSMRR